MAVNEPINAAMTAHHTGNIESLKRKIMRPSPYFLLSKIWLLGERLSPMLVT
jgi:hypothetical protein